MAVYSLENEQIKISVDTFGAELKSLKKTATDTEYMWDARPEYWKRTSPVLFPIVGSLNNGSYRYDGKEYPMSQHGFARDMEFELRKETRDELKFVLRATEETKARYPFDFELELGYRLDENNLIVSWKVANCGSREMYFSIGGHPAFLCPIDDTGVQTDYKLLFDTDNKIIASIIGNGGTLSARTKEYALKDRTMDIAADLFDEDALIIENNQAHKVSLCNPAGQPYLTVSFDAPLFGLWSPAKKNAPFVCIEPWYGRCDRETFDGDLSEREWGNKLAPGAEFNTEYTA
ncbi:MAG: aldose 1-epimerase family protein, partial [Lachnospiraceae bacterium]|nr:aldose 1-epimerase family protein [Lachnospiraceae bacterium]